jgi:hypothetical protein
MATNYNYFGNLVTSGLVLDLDAAKIDSYPGSGTTWRDISGNGNNGTLTNGPTFTGIGKQAAIVFDGIDDKVVTANSFTQTNVTLNTWFQFNNISDQICAQSWNYSTTGGFTIEIYGGNLVFAVNGPSGAYPTFPVSSSITGSFRNLTGTLSGNTQTLYLNGSPISSVTDANRNNSNSNTPLTVGARSTGGPSTSFSNGKCGVAQVYNRAISQFEVWQNFNALKSRYGIPDIVTNGLVLNLDAGNPFSYLSGSSGTTWTNTVAVSSSISGTLVNGTSYSNGSMVFDGTNDTINISGLILPIGSGDYGVEAWVNRTTVPANISKAIISGDSNNAFYFGFGQTYNGTNGLRIGKSNIADAENCAFPFVANTWYHVVVTRISSVVSFYVNAQQQSTSGSGTSGFSFPSSSLAKIGGSGPTVTPNPSEYFYGNISGVRTYNRGLSQAEITQNFNALRGRYGI